MSGDGGPTGASGRPRIVAVVNASLLSGAERVLVRYLRALLDAGWTASCCGPVGPLTDELDGLGVDWIEVPELKPGAGSRLGGLLGLARAEAVAARRLRRALAPADVVLVNALMALPAVAMARPSAPVAWLVHDVVRRRDLRLVAGAARGVVDRAVAVSEASARFPRHLGLDTRVVANGTRWPVEPRRGPWPSPPVVGVNGALTAWKGQHVLLEAAALVPEVTVELMGGTFPRDGAYEATLRRRAEADDLAGRVRFLGHVDDPLARMRTWTVAVSASVEPEAAPLNVLEAMSLGLPVVGTDHGGTPEVLDGVGELVAPGDGPALAAAIRWLAGDERRRDRLGRAARARVERDHTLEVAEARFIEAIDELTVAPVGGVGGRRR